MYTALDLTGKVAVITGGAGGIGQSTAELFVGRGARVAIADIAYDAAVAVAGRLGEAALAVELDLTNEESVAACVTTIVARFGRIDILVNNATATGRELVENDGVLGNMPTALWDQMFEVNCRGTMLITRETLPHLIEAKGSIVNTVAGLGLQGHIRQTAYGSTKAALIQLTRSIATAYGPHGVRCNAVAPGLVLTPTVAKDFPASWRKLVEDETPRGIAGAPEDVAESIAFLASDAARNITGHTLVSDGGVSIHVPGLAAYRAAFG